MTLVILLLAALADYRAATPGYQYQFPRDHFSHPDFRTEWWYYTGNLHGRDGHRYGFELVFFRQGQGAEKRGPPSAWRLDDVFLAHLALTDIDGRRFRYYTRMNRAGPGIAGSDFDQGRIWNGNWQTVWDRNSGLQTLSAVAEDIRFTLKLTPRTPVVIHGENGISRKAAGAGRASHYVSFPRLDAQGTLNGKEVEGLAWMDHEWFSRQLDPSQRGWDWFSVQLRDGSELMLFDLRRMDGDIDAFSSGTFIARDGHATHLRRADFQLTPLEYWASPTTGTRYPVRWRIEVPAFRLSLDCVAALPGQELVFQDEASPSYWEGAVIYSGSAEGVGYLEMTGYGKPVRL